MSIHVAIIGLGAIGKKRFDLFLANPNVDKVSFFDPTIKEYEAISSVDTVDRLFMDASIDAVVICTPNVQKSDLITKALHAKKHIFCEKPPVISHAEGLVLESLYRDRTNIKIQFGFNHRYLSHYRLLRDIIISGKYGEPLWVRGVYGKGFDDSFFEGWRAKKSLSGGGIFLDQGIHMLDLVLDLLGDLKVNNVLVDKADGHPGIELNAFIHLRSHEGVPVSLHSSMLQWRHKFCLEVGTEEAIIGIDGIKSSTKSYGDETIRIDRHWKNNFVESQIHQYANADYYTFRDECTDFVESIIKNRPVANGTLRDAIRIMKLVDTIYSYA